MAWMTTTKTKAGFEYSIGSLIIARAIWTKRAQGGWVITLYHMEHREDKFGCMATGNGVVMPLGEVAAYLHGLMRDPPKEQQDIILRDATQSSTS